MTEPDSPRNPRSGLDVLIVEDHALLAESLALLLRSEGMTVECSESLDPTSIVEAAETSRPSVVLLDLDLGASPGSSVDLISGLRAAGSRVAMLTGVTDRIRLAQCVESGAVGIIRKAQPSSEVLEAIRRVVSGADLLSRDDRMEHLAELRRHRTFVRRRREPFDRLTPREAQILAALIDGASADTIARESYVSLATVRTQIRSVLEKLGTHSQVAAVALARKARWSLGPERPDPRDAPAMSGRAG